MRLWQNPRVYCPVNLCRFVICLSAQHAQCGLGVGGGCAESPGMCREVAEGPVSTGVGRTEARSTGAVVLFIQVTVKELGQGTMGPQAGSGGCRLATGWLRGLPACHRLGLSQLRASPGFGPGVSIGERVQAIRGFRGAVLDEEFLSNCL